jgi:hypothetical protein
MNWKQYNYGNWAVEAYVSDWAFFSYLPPLTRLTMIPEAGWVFVPGGMVGGIVLQKLDAGSVFVPGGTVGSIVLQKLDAGGVYVPGGDQGRIVT